MTPVCTFDGQSMNPVEAGYFRKGRHRDLGPKSSQTRLNAKPQCTKDKAKTKPLHNEFAPLSIKALDNTRA